MEESKTNFYKTTTVLAMALTVLIVAMIITEIKSYKYIGGGVAATNTISVSGDGEVYAAPDIATISFTVQEKAKKLADAQDAVNKKVQASLDGVRKAGVAEKDIKLQNYSSYPTYEWQSEGSAPCSADVCPAYYYRGKQVLNGYEVSQTVIITVRDLDKVSTLVDGLGTSGVTNIQGPAFAIDKIDDIKAEARKEAIEKAEAKAEVLAKDLNVNLVRIVSFSESGDYPMYRAEASYAKGMGMAPESASLPDLPKGEQKVVSNVTISYEIR